MSIRRGNCRFDMLTMTRMESASRLAMVDDLARGSAIVIGNIGLGSDRVHDYDDLDRRNGADSCCNCHATSGSRRVDRNAMTIGIDRSLAARDRTTAWHLRRIIPDRERLRGKSSSAARRTWLFLPGSSASAR